MGIEDLTFHLYLSGEDFGFSSWKYGNLVNDERLDLRFTVDQDGRSSNNFQQFDYFNSMTDDGFESVRGEATTEMINCKLERFVLH